MTTSDTTRGDNGVKLYPRHYLRVRLPWLTHPGIPDFLRVALAMEQFCPPDSGACNASSNTLSAVTGISADKVRLYRARLVQKGVFTKVDGGYVPAGSINSDCLARLNEKSGLYFCESTTAPPITLDTGNPFDIATHPVQQYLSTWPEVFDAEHQLARAFWPMMARTTLTYQRKLKDEAIPNWAVCYTLLSYMGHKIATGKVTRKGIKRPVGWLRSSLRGMPFDAFRESVHAVVAQAEQAQEHPWVSEVLSGASTLPTKRNDSGQYTAHGDGWRLRADGAYDVRDNEKQWARLDGENLDAIGRNASNETLQRNCAAAYEHYRRRHLRVIDGTKGVDTCAGNEAPPPGDIDMAGVR